MDIRRFEGCEPWPEDAATPAFVGALLSAVALAGCQGTDGPSGSGRGIDGIGLALSGDALRTGQPRLHRLDAGSEAGRAIRYPSATALMDWVERAYPGYFPGPQTDIVVDHLVYRRYPATGNHVGVSERQVYLLGPVTAGQLLHVGALTDFASFVYPEAVPAGDPDSVRLLHQAQFGATDEDLAAVQARGYGGWLHDQFSLPAGTSGGAWLDARGFDTIDAENRFFLQSSLGDRMAWAQLLSRPDTLRVRVALALSEYFVVSISGIDNTGAWVVNYGAAGYWDLLCQHAFGSFRALLEAVTLSFPMGRFLGTLDNLKEDPTTGRMPDENYAREVMQLFTIGLHELNRDGTPRLDAQGRRIETFSMEDVTGLARVFTGYSGHWAANRPTPVSTQFSPNGLLDDTLLCRRPMINYPFNHSTLAASFLGTHIAAGTDAPLALKVALDALAAHPNVGPFFGRQMIQRLVTSDPSPGYVQRVADAFDDNGFGVRGDLRAVFTAILLDDEARSASTAARSGWGKVREPMVRFAQWAHTFAGPSTRARWYLGDTSAATALGQSPLRSPTVFNFFRPGYVPPGTAMALAGATAPEFQIVNETTVASYLNFMLPYVRNGVPVQERVRDTNGGFVTNPAITLPASYTRELPLASNPEALVARLSLLLAAGRLGADTAQLIADALRAIELRPGDSSTQRARVAAAVLLVMASPEYLVQK